MSDTPDFRDRGGGVDEKASYPTEKEATEVSSKKESITYTDTHEGSIDSELKTSQESLGAHESQNLSIPQSTHNIHGESGETIDAGSQTRATDEPIEAQVNLIDLEDGPSANTLKLEKPTRSDPPQFEEASKRRTSRVSVEESEKPAAEDDVPFDFQAFLDQMKTKPADPIVRYLRSFLAEFGKRNWTAQTQVKLINDFQVFIRGKMRECPPFDNLDATRWMNATEGMEKLIMNRLYERTFSPKLSYALLQPDHLEDLKRDKIVWTKMKHYSWIEGRHLDIDEGLLAKAQSFMNLACTELNKINQYRSPRDKVICILNCSKVIWALIRQAKLEQNADSFLPVLIYVIIRSQPVNLVSNINYITRFRCPEKQLGETGYYLSMAAGAVAFVEGLECSSLTISAEEFEGKMADTVEMSPKSLKASSPPVEDPSTPEPSNLPSNVLIASKGLLVDQLKLLSSRLFDIDDLPSSEHTGSQSPNLPSRSETPTPVSELQPVSPTTRSGGRFDLVEDQAARQASAEEYQAQQQREKQFSEVSNTLQQMFPTLDREVIEDVLQEKEARIGAAIDICLTLVGES